MKKSPELQTALKAAEKAGKIALEHWGSEIETEIKKDKTPVTAVDRECEKTIIEIIKQQFRNASFLGEEGGSIGNSREKWIIDPIDGTKNFFRGFPEWGTMIALEKNGKIVVGVITMPVFKKTLFAEKGKGAFLNEEKIFVSEKNDLKESTVYFETNKSFFSKPKNLSIFNEVKQSTFHLKNTGGCDAIAYVAEGKADAFIWPVSMPWDFAAGKIIVEEAGGTFSDFDGRESIYTGNGFGGNKEIHKKLLEILKNYEKYL